MLRIRIRTICYWASRSGSISIRYGSSSGYFCHQAKLLWKTWTPTVLWHLYDFLSLKKKDVNVASKSTYRIKQKIWEHFSPVPTLKVTDENSRIRMRGSDPDPLVRGTDPRIRIQIRTKTDPQHCFARGMFGRADGLLRYVFKSIQNNEKRNILFVKYF